MAVSNHDQHELTITNRTIIGSITGQLHLVSGNINVFNPLSSSTVSTKDEFLAALQAFRAQLEIARQQGLPEETVDDTDIEIEAAEREAKKNEPKAKRIVARLENAKTTLIVGTGAATFPATAGLVAFPTIAAGRLISLTESARKVFKVS